MYLFSYGSNNQPRLSARLRHGIKVYPALARGYKRIFVGKSVSWDGFAVASLEESDSIVFGIAASVSEKDLDILDKYEGNYTRETIQIEIPDIGQVDAIAYIAISDEIGLPSQEYLDAVAKTINMFWREDSAHYLASLTQC